MPTRAGGFDGTFLAGYSASIYIFVPSYPRDIPSGLEADFFQFGMTRSPSFPSLVLPITAVFHCITCSIYVVNIV